MKSLLSSADSRKVVVSYWQKCVLMYWLTAYRTKHAHGKYKLT